MVIARLKSNKAAAVVTLPAELLKHGGEELAKCMLQLLCGIWPNESMPDDWNFSVFWPIHKKEDHTVYA